jgi:hypothetical protein
MTLQSDQNEDKLASARRQGQAQFDSIVEMVDRLKVAEEQAIDGPDETEAARRWIEEDALSVLVRSGWHMPGSEDDQKAEEYEILLCTGGPAVRIIGQLNEFGEPETARLEVQDWFQPWTAMRPLVAKGDYDSESTLLAYARVFYFGEG